MTKDAARRAARMLAWTFSAAAACFALALTAIAFTPQPAPFFPSATIELRPLAAAAPPVQPVAIKEASTTGEALKSLLAEHRCLAQVMYYEARGEGEEGEKAVAEVVFHRLAEGGHGKTLCAVIYEGAGETFCQFTFACDGSLMKPKDAQGWRRAELLAAQLMAGELIAPDDVEGATYYHAASVDPGWAPRLEKVAQIGHHIFYRARDALRVSLR